MLVDSKLASGMNEARRLIVQGGVKLNGEKLLADQPVVFVANENEEEALRKLAKGTPVAFIRSADAVLQLGSRRFCKLVKG
jgi:ribosomal protein S4